MSDKKNTSDIRPSGSGSSPPGSMDDGNKFKDKTQDKAIPKREFPEGLEETREASKTGKMDQDTESFRGEKNARSSINEGSPTSGSKEWAQENLNKGPKTHKTRYW
jgi:hypothetical protein